MKKTLLTLLLIPAFFLTSCCNVATVGFTAGDAVSNQAERILEENKDENESFLHETKDVLLDYPTAIAMKTVSFGIYTITLPFAIGCVTSPDFRW